MKQPEAEDLRRYAAALEWAVHQERERILHEVLALMPTVDNAVDRDAVVRVIG